MAVAKGEPPRALVCPITLDLMRDPVVDANGHTFERSAIERVLVLRPGISPQTNAAYPNGDARLTPNYIARDMSDAFREAAGEAAFTRLLRDKRTIIATKEHENKET
jgi:hypothetical protein